MTEKEFDAKWKGVDRDLLEEEQFEEFISDCYAMYEETGFLEKFDSPYDDEGEHNGIPFKVLRPIPVNNDDDIVPESLPVWEIQFSNGDIRYCYPEEICKIEHRRKTYYQPILKDTNTVPFPLHDFEVFPTRKAAEEYMRGRKRKVTGFTIKEYHDNDIEEVTVLDANGQQLIVEQDNKNPLRVPDITPMLHSVTAFVQMHQTEKGFILTSNPDNEHDNIRCFVYDGAERRGVEAHVKAVRVDENDDLQVIIDNENIVYSDSDVKDAPVEDTLFGSWLSVYNGDAIYCLDALFNIADFIREYV